MTYEYDESNKTLEYINIPYGYTSIDEKAFYECCNSKIISVPNSVKKICKKAFYNMSINMKGIKGSNGCLIYLKGIKLL